VFEVDALTPKGDKKVKSKHVKSMLRDARFMRDLQGLFESAGQPESLGTSVCNASTPSPYSPHTPLTDSTHKRQRTRVRPWYRQHLADPLRRHRTPPQWRDASNYLKLEFYHLALAELGPAHAFTANLSPEIEAGAIATGKPLDWLRRNRPAWAAL
jgi:hypothetical protein